MCARWNDEIPEFLIKRSTHATHTPSPNAVVLRTYGVRARFTRAAPVRKKSSAENIVVIVRRTIDSALYYNNNNISADRSVDGKSKINILFLTALTRLEFDFETIIVFPYYFDWFFVFL
jgi:hypothetical protein